MTTPRMQHTATLLADGRVLLVGGLVETEYGVSTIGSTEIYDPQTGTFSPTGSFFGEETSAEAVGAALLPDGRVAILEYPTAVAIYDPGTGTFDGPVPIPNGPANGDAYGATLLADGRLLVIGGKHGPSNENGINPLLATWSEIYDPQTGAVRRTDPMATLRERPMATLLTDGRVLIIGGGGNSYDEDGNPLPLASAEVFDPVTGTFTATGPMEHGLLDATSTLLADGRVLVVGSCYEKRGPCSEDNRKSEIYDPQTGTFSPGGATSTPRGSGSTATLLADGRVLVIGGEASGSSAELYDPKTARFSRTGSMTRPRSDFTATLLADGRVLIAGGVIALWPADSEFDEVVSAVEVLASAEIYDPKAGTFSPTGP